MKKTTALDNLLALFALALLCVLVVLLSGCASFHTKQLDSATPTTNGIARVTTTRASARAVLASKQTLQGWTARQSEKTQGASVGGLSQESDASKLIESMTALAKMLAVLQAGPAAGLLSRSEGQPSSPQFFIPEGYELVRRPSNREVPPGFEVVPVRPRATPLPELAPLPPAPVPYVRGALHELINRTAPAPDDEERRRLLDGP